MSENTIDCTLNGLFNLTNSSGSCKLTTTSGAFISIWNRLADDFEYKFKSLTACFARNGIVVPADLTRENTLWIELLKNGGVKGIGKKFLDIFKHKALENGYKYVFLYPSKNLGASKDQDRLIGYYESVGFHKLSSCDFWDDNPLMTRKIITGTINKYDLYAPFHLMLAKIEDLNTESSAFESTVVNYRNKYLKYKAKYLELKATTQY